MSKKCGLLIGEGLEGPETVAGYLSACIASMMALKKSGSETPMRSTNFKGICKNQGLGVML